MDYSIQNDILSFFPTCVIENDKAIFAEKMQEALEIRLRTGQPMILKLGEEELILTHVLTSQDMVHLLENFCHRSIYASQTEINQGFITLNGGYRVGISGNCVWENSEVKNIKEVCSMNIRIAREVKGCSFPILNQIIEYNTFQNTLLISPPGCGKTTILRDMILELSNGYKNMQGQTISLIDERSEIASVYKGIPQNDVGKRTDVMSNIPKWKGMKMMIRSMSPDILATDEIGSKEDMEAIQDAMHAGIKLLLTLHGNSLEDIPFLFRTNGSFRYVVILKKQHTPGVVKSIYRWEDKEYVICA